MSDRWANASESEMEKAIDDATPMADRRWSPISYQYSRASGFINPPMLITEDQTHPTPGDGEDWNRHLKKKGWMEIFVSGHEFGIQVTAYRNEHLGTFPVLVDVWDVGSQWCIIYALAPADLIELLHKLEPILSFNMELETE